MNDDLVSVIIPAYNHRKYIQETLQSIINQTYGNIELIIINDGSTDDTHERISEMEFLLRENTVRYIYIDKDNEGVCKTLNRGLALAKGKYIVPFASDDVMYPDRIEKQVSYLNHHPDFGVVYTDGYSKIADGPMKFDSSFLENNRFSCYFNFCEGYIFQVLLKDIFLMPTATVCIKKECYEAVGNYDERLLCEDLDMFLRLSKVFKFGYIKEVLTIHRIHANNSGTNRKILNPCIMKMKEEYSNSKMFTPEERNILFDTFYKYTGI